MTRTVYLGKPRQKNETLTKQCWKLRKPESQRCRGRELRRCR